MNTEDFMHVWSHEIPLRQYIVDQAKRHSKNKEDQQDYVQEAWLAISLARDGLCVTELHRIAYNAIRNQYRRDRREKYTSIESTRIE